MKTIEQVKIEMEAIQNGYPNAQSIVRLSNGYAVTIRKYDNRGNFEYSIYTSGKNTRLKIFNSYAEFIKSINNYLKRQ